MEQLGIDIPEIGSTWKHRNGNIYKVTNVVNTLISSEKYPILVIYKGGNGAEWGRPLTRWYASMTSTSSDEDLL